MLLCDVVPKELQRLVGSSLLVSGFGFRLSNEAVFRRVFRRVRGLASKGDGKDDKQYCAITVHEQTPLWNSPGNQTGNRVFFRAKEAIGDGYKVKD
jgi:hypothetical protein